MKPYFPLLLSATLLVQLFSQFAIAQSAPSATDTLTAQPGGLANVTVMATKPYLEQKADRLIIQVTQSPMAAGDNIYEVIKRAPGITEGNGLQFRGKKAVVYINGTPSRLSGEELQNWLSAMPAGTVEKVEMLSAPSARYEANGGAVINIILAKSKNLGTNGTLTAGGGMGIHARYNSGMNLNHRTAKMNIYGSYDILHTTVSGHTDASRFLQAGSQINETINSLDPTTSHNIKAGIDYTLSGRSSAGILLRSSLLNKEKEVSNQSLLHYTTNTKAGADSASVLSNQNSNRFLTPAVNVYYKLKTGPASELIINGDYYQYRRDRNDRYNTRYLDEKQQEYQQPLLLRNQSAPQNQIRSLSADYSFTYAKIQYETGAKALFTTTNNDLLWETMENGNWQNDVTKSNHFIYNENIYAAYLNGSGSIGKVDIQAGLRMEHTATTGNSVTLNQTTQRNFTNLFPSLGIGWNATASQQWGFTYNRKIERFNFNTVNPFITYTGPYTRTQGNPYILPTYSHNFGLTWNKGSEWMISLSYGYYKDVEVDVFRKSTTEDVMISSSDNADGAGQWDATVSHSKKFFHNKLVSVNSFSAMHAQYYAPVASGLNSAAFAGMFSSSQIVTLSSGCKAELSAAYQSPLVFGAYHIRSVFTMGLGISQQLWNKRGTLSLNVSDLLNSNRSRFTASSYQVRSVTSYKPESRIVKLSFTWRFGNQQVKAAAGRRTGIDEAKRRME